MLETARRASAEVPDSPRLIVLVPAKETTAVPPITRVPALMLIAPPSVPAVVGLRVTVPAVVLFKPLVPAIAADTVPDCKSKAAALVSKPVVPLMVPALKVTAARL